MRTDSRRVESLPCWAVSFNRLILTHCLISTWESPSKWFVQVTEGKITSQGFLQLAISVASQRNLQNRRPKEIHGWLIFFVYIPFLLGFMGAPKGRTTFEGLTGRIVVLGKVPSRLVPKSEKRIAHFMPRGKTS